MLSFVILQCSAVEYKKIFFNIQIFKIQLLIHIPIALNSYPRIWTN